MATPNFFSHNSPFLQHPLLTADRTAQEVDFIVTRPGFTPGGRVLDVGCGFGRHSIELAQRGCQVVGIDPAPAMITAAQAKARQAAVSVHFYEMSGEAFSGDLLLERPFDAALCLFTTLGQIGETGQDNEALISSVYQALRPGGIFIVEVPQRQAAVRSLKPADKFGDEVRYTAVSRQFDPQPNIVTETFTVVTPAETRTYLLQYKLYSQTELTHLLIEAGFEVTAVYADYQESPLTPDSPTMLFVTSQR